MVLQNNALKTMDWKCKNRGNFKKKKTKMLCVLSFRNKRNIWDLLKKKGAEVNIE